MSVLEVPVELENSGRSTVRVARDASVLMVDLLHMRIDLARGRYPLQADSLAAPAAEPSPTIN